MISAKDIFFEIRAKEAQEDTNPPEEIIEDGSY